MSLEQHLPVVAGAGFIVATGAVALNGGRLPRGAWIAPALLSAAFFAWSLWAVIDEGPTGFWPEHTRNKWGAQIWFDLLLAVGAGWALIARPAKELGMNLYAWLALTICTGSIGFLAMLSRYLRLRENVGD
ncbi:MAG: hypothetical protein AAGJ87_11135 [Pseudomonadota bacterium]